ncbi:hypothetical protein AeNC1_008471 [Aphanomyces euteiches]|nr:hypothetical protein AeNC1_008471 [Aphanomyces euteiches]
MAASIQFLLQETFGVGGDHHVGIGLTNKQDNVHASHAISTISAYKCIPGVALFAGRQDGKLVVWNYANQTNLLAQGHLFGGHGGPVLAIEHTQRHDNTQLLFTGSADRTIKVWDPTRAYLDEQCIQTLNAHGGSITALKVAGTTLVSCSVDRTIKLWQPDKGRALLLHPWYVCTQTVSNGGSWPTSICVRATDLSSTYVADSTGTVSVYTTANNRERLDPTNEDQLKLKRLHNHFHTLGITKVMAIPDQNVIVTLSFDTKAQVFDATTGAVLLTLENPKHCRYTACDWDRTNHELHVVDDTGHLYIWSIETEKCVKVAPLGKGPIMDVTVFPGQKGHSVLLQRPDGAEMYHIQRDVSYVECHGHTDAVVAIVPVHSDPLALTGETRLFTASIDNSLRCWDAYNLKVLYGFEEKEGELSSMAYSAKHHRLLTGNENGSLKLWNIDNGQFFTTQVHRNTVSAILVASVGQHEFIISADFDGTIWIWEMAHGSSPPIPHCKIQTKEPNHDSEIFCLAFNAGDYLQTPHAAFFAAGDSNGDIRLYSLDDQELLTTLSNHEDSVTCLAFDGCFLFSGSDDHTIRMWNVLDPRRGYELGAIQAHDVAVRDLLILPSTGFVVSCAYDGKIRVWNYQVCGSSYGQYAAMVHEFKKREKLRCLAYWQHKNAIVCGTSDKNVLVFDIPKSVRHGMVA